LAVVGPGWKKEGRNLPVVVYAEDLSAHIHSR